MLQSVLGSAVKTLQFLQSIAAVYNNAETASLVSNPNEEVDESVTNQSAK